MYRIATLFKASIKFLFILLVCYACKETKDKPPIVRVRLPEVKNVEVFGEYTGRVKAYKHVEVRARVEGFLQKKLFEEGKPVQEGDLLFEIDPTMYLAKLNAAKAKLKQANAAKSSAEKYVKRLKPLFEKNAASQQDLDNAESALDAAIADIAFCQAEVEQANMELSFTKVRSPLSGYVGERNVDIGALVGGSGVSLLTSVVQTDTVFISFSLTALDYLRSKGRNVDLAQADSTKKWKPTVTVTLADDSEYPIKGEVDFTNPEVDSKTGTFIVRAKLQNMKRELLPGQFTKVKLLLNVIEDAFVIPRKSIIIEDGGAYVYIMRKDSVAEKRLVLAGTEIANNIIIERGLSRLDQVVIEGQHKLLPGIKMRAVAPSDTIYQPRKEEE